MSFDANSKITAFGATRRVCEWAKLPQCQCGEAILIRRLNAGVAPARAIIAGTLPADQEQPAAASPPPAAAPSRPAPPIEQPKPRKRHSKYIGVSKREGVWYAQIRVSRTEVKFLGQFDTEHQAALAYDAAARPVGKPLNFPGGTPATP